MTEPTAEEIGAAMTKQLQLRIVVRICDAAAAANVGGPVHERLVTFLCDAPDGLDEALRGGAYSEASIIGVEAVWPESENADNEVWV